MRTLISKMRGVSTVEYALLIVALLGVLGTMTALLTGSFESMFTALSQEMVNAVT